MDFEEREMAAAHLENRNVELFNDYIRKSLQLLEEPLFLGSMAITVLNCQKTLVKSGQCWEEHEHPDYELAVMEQGSMETRCNTVVVRNFTGSRNLLLLPPATLHKREFGHGDSIVFSMILSLEFEDNVALSQQINNEIVRRRFEFRLTSDLAAILKQLNILASTLDPRNMRSTGILLHAFLTLFFGQLLPLKEKLPPVPIHLWDERMKNVKNLMPTIIRDKHPANWLAEQLRLSTHHLNRLFRSETGMTIKQYQLELRKRRAVNLLVHSTLPVTAIGETIGYPKAEQFSNFFIKHFQCSPTDYRRRMWKQNQSRSIVDATEEQSMVPQIQERHSGERNEFAESDPETLG